MAVIIMAVIFFVFCFVSDVAPPTYEQVFGVQKMKQEVMEARQSSSRPVFAVKLCNILCGSGT